MLDLSVVIISTSIKTAETLEVFFHNLGLPVVVKLQENENALNVIKNIKPGLVVVEGVPSFIDLAKIIKKNNIVPIILFSDQGSLGSMNQIKSKWGCAFLEKDSNEAKWRTAIKISRDTFIKRNELMAGYEKINSAQTTRQIVNQATLLLMKHWGSSEVQALYNIQILAYNQGLNIRNMAQKIILAHKIKEETA